MNASALLDLLACTVCRSPLAESEGGAALRCTSCGHRFPVVEGRPVFIENPDEVEVRPPDHVSNALNDEIHAWISGRGGTVLHLGAGATDQRFDNCVEGEYAIFRNTDVALDAHRLPFCDNAFAGVLTLNTFEHLRDPPAAAAELRRVMRPGAEIWLQTAWLQPLHEAPVHFYGATEFGLREWFDGFTIDAVTVPANMNPCYAVSWLASDLLGVIEHHLGPEERERFGQLTLAELREFWINRDYAGPVWSTTSRLPEIAQRQCSAGFELRARKPFE